LLSFIVVKKIDIVHTHSSKAGIVGRFAAAAGGVRHIYHTVHGWPFHKFQHPLPWMVIYFLEKCAAFFTSRIIVVSEHDKLSGLRCGIGSPSKYSMVRYGIHMQEFEDKCPSLRGCFGIPAGTLVVGMVACFKPQKAVSDFVAVARGVCSSETGVLFMIAGDGAQRARIEKLIKRYGLEGRIILLGWRRDIARFISSCDVFMLTSLWEGMPISVIEAMAASLPVIVTDTGGVKELIRDGENGFLIRPGNIPEMERNY